MPTGLIDARQAQAEYDATIAKTDPPNVLLRNPPDADDDTRRNPDWLGLDGTREGSADELELSPAAREAVQDALRRLTPHAADHVGVGGILGRLRSIAESGKAPRLDDETREIEKCANASLELRSLLAESDLPASAQETVRHAIEKCDNEYLAGHSVGAANAMARRAECTRLGIPFG